LFEAERIFMLVDLLEPFAADVVVCSCAVAYAADELGAVSVGEADGVVAAC
jgi:hypothetical protein